MQEIGLLFFFYMLLNLQGIQQNHHNRNISQYKLKDVEHIQSALKSHRIKIYRKTDENLITIAL